MADEAYERLAEALDALPNRFPRTESGVEIKILKWLYTPEQAHVFGYLKREPQTVEEIAEKAGLSSDQVKQQLDTVAMQMMGVARKRIVDGQEKFRLGPYILGIYEGTVEAMDKEFAELVEQHFREGAARTILEPQPGIMDIIPVRGSVKPELLDPHEDIDAHFQRHERFYVLNCICRVQKNFIGSDCTMPVRRCAFVGMPASVPVSESILDREQALKLFTELEEMGHVHMGFYGYIFWTGEPQFMGCCNCCPDCCGVLRAMTEFGAVEAPQRSNYRAVVDMDACTSCGDCVQRCPIGAITEESDGTPIFNREKCFGCGQCALICPVDAIEMEKLPEEERFYPPRSMEEWEELRMRNMGWIS